MSSENRLRVEDAALHGVKLRSPTDLAGLKKIMHQTVLVEGVRHWFPRFGGIMDGGQKLMAKMEVVDVCHRRYFPVDKVLQSFPGPINIPVKQAKVRNNS